MNEHLASIVRRSVRYDVSIRASISVLPEHGSLVRFAGAAGARDGWVDVDLVDFSSSGVGLMCGVFVPRRTLLMARLYSYGPDAKVIVEAPLRVQRVCMTDRRPGYLVGTSFADPAPKAIDQINRLLELLAGPEEPAAGASR
jgi:hypothetical protein